MRAGSLEELDVFQSGGGGLTNQTLDTLIGLSVEMDGVDERAPSSKLQKANLPHPHMVLQLSSLMTSDNKSINPASTHKYSDSCLSDDVVFINNLSGTINQNENKEGYFEFTATFMQSDFEMIAPPQFRKRDSDYESSQSDVRLKKASTECSESDDSEIDLSEFLDELPLPTKAKHFPVNFNDLVKT